MSEGEPLQWLWSDAWVLVSGSQTGSATAADNQCRRGDVQPRSRRALVMGATTYEWMVDHDRMLDNPGKWCEYYSDRPGWVFTHRDLPQIPGVQISFVSGDVRPVYEQIAGQLPEANIWLVGVGDLAGEFYDVGLLDQIILGMTPVTLSEGRRCCRAGLPLSASRSVVLS